MAQLVPAVVKDQCVCSNYCPSRMCQKCWHWYDSSPGAKKHPCHEREKPTRDLLMQCPNCRAGMRRYDNKSWPERDAREKYCRKAVDRIVYANEHPRQKNGRRPEVAVRNTRATNAARTLRAVR